MNKDTIIRAIEHWNENNKKKFIWAKDLTEEQKRNALETYAMGTDQNDWIAMYDQTIGKNGKKGFLFVGEKLYGKKLKQPVDLEQMERIMGEGRIYVWLLGCDGSVKDSDDGIGMQEILPILREITGGSQAAELPKEKYAYLRQNYERELKRRFKILVNDISAKSGEIRSVDVVNPIFVQNAIKINAPGTLPDRVVAVVDRADASGKRGVLVTWEGIYCGIAKKDARLQFDGLKEVVWVRNTVYLGIYENGYVEHIHLYIANGHEKHFLELVNGIIAVYRELHEEVQTNQMDKFGLDVSAGWAAFEQKRKENTLDTYKNAVFVSSTFRDMHFERDIIHEKVQPSLNALAEKYGETLAFCDLRWGVNTEELDSEEGAKKVLIVCLDEIERCDPYMLILLGERYGWIPNERTIKNALEGRPEFVLDELEKSVTALEIEFGALAKDTPKERIFVYFREMNNAPSEIYGSEDAYHAKKLSELKNRVKKLVPERVKSYTLTWNEQTQAMDGIDAFANMVTDDIGNVMEKEWQSRTRLTQFEEEIAQHWSYAEKKAAGCYARDAFLKMCLKSLDEDYHLMALQGISGCGKSTVMGALAVILKSSNTEVLPLFCGHTEATNAAIELVQHIVYYLEELLQQSHENQKDTSDETWIVRMNQLAEQYSREKEKPLIILIDAVDQLVADSVRNNLKFVPENISAFSSKINMVISCLDDFELAAFPLVHHVPLLTEEDKPVVISGVLKRNRRELDRTVIEAITKKNASDSPLYLTLLIQRLLMMNKNDFDDIASDGDDMSAITNHQLKIVADSGETISEVCKETIETAAQRIGGNFVKEAVDYIVASRYGLRESDLAGLLTGMGVVWNRLEFSIFINYVRNIFVLREDGCYDFSHKIIRQELADAYGQTSDRHRRLFRWLQHLPKQDSLRMKELLYHCMEAGDADSFVSFIKEMTEGKADTAVHVKDILVRCRRDKGEWLARTLALVSDKRIDIDYEFFRLFAYDVLLSFDNSEEELLIRERLASVLLDVAKYLKSIKADMDSQRSVGIVYSRLGKIYQLRDDKKAITYYNEALKESNILAERLKEEKLYVDIALDMRTLANAYVALGGEENRKQALWHYEKSVEMAEQVCQFSKLLYAKRTLGWSYRKLAEFHDDEKEYEKAQVYYESCAKVCEEVVEEEPTDTHIQELCSAYVSVAQGCKDSEPRKALEFYEKVIIYREGLVRENRILINLKDLAWAYSWAGFFLYNAETEKNEAKALDYFEKCIPVFEEVLKRDEDMYMVWTLSDNCGYVMDILSNLGGANNQIKLERIAEKGLYWCEYRAKKTDENRAYLSWIAMLSSYANQTQNVQVATECWEKTIELYELLYKRTRDRAYKKIIRETKLLISGKRLLNKI